MEFVDSIGVYWGPRKETAAECASRLRRYLLGLSNEHALLSNWYLKQRSRKAEKTPVRLQGDDLADLIEVVTAGLNRRDVGGDVIESLGFRVSLWNGLDEEESFGLSIKCGLFEQKPNLGNAAVLTVPSDASAGLTDKAFLKRLLVHGIEAWEPDWGAIFFSGSSALENRIGNGPFLDQALWIKKGESSMAGEVKREPLLGGALLER